MQPRSGVDRAKLETRSRAFATAAFAFSTGLRRQPGVRGPADQLVDCATAVGANYRATARARSRPEFVAKLGVVVEEVDEAVYWLEFAIDAGLGDLEMARPLLQEARELRAIFAASYRTARRNARRRVSG